MSFTWARRAARKEEKDEQVEVFEVLGRSEGVVGVDQVRQSDLDVVRGLGQARVEAVRHREDGGDGVSR